MWSAFGWTSYHRWITQGVHHRMVPMLKQTDHMPNGTGDAAIRARGVHKIYAGTGGAPDKEALKHIDLEVPRGSIFGLLGPNGAGKSTFINILAGLVVKTAGEVEVWGFDIDKNPRQARASIGVVPQELSVDVFFTPVEALEIQAGLYGVPKNKRRTMEILRALGLEDKAKSYSRTLSGGMKRRLLVAKAMVHTPPILVLDEPTAGVDIELRRQLWEYVQELNANGVTVVLTTHYLEEAEALCDRIAIINHGNVVASESKDKLLSRIEEKCLVIQPVSELAQVPQQLNDLGTKLQSDGRLMIPFNPTVMALEDILSLVRETGIQIQDLSTEESDLEDVFLKLTYGADEANAS